MNSQQFLPDRYSLFNFFDSAGADGAETFVVNPDTRTTMQFEQLRAHWSTAFASVEDMVVYISSAKGSAYNLVLLSQALAGITDILFQPEKKVWLFSGDNLVISFSCASGVNTVGIEVQGWSVFG